MAARERIELTEYATMVNAQRRVLSDIGLERRTKDITPSITQYLATTAESPPAKEEESP